LGIGFLTRNIWEREGNDMESIIWFLIIGALFFFMMRSGCGGHIGGHGGCGGGPGGHEGHGGGGEGLSTKVKDPVCGMEINKDQAYAMVRREGKEIYFCSENCQNKFNAEPKKYL
jgi:YHS domain-containing protein